MANANPAGIDELEEKKWMISRIDLYHQIMREAFSNDLKKLEEGGEKAFSDLRRYRNGILSGLGIILTVILAINTTYQINQILFVGILAGLGVVSLIVLIIYNLATKIIENIFSAIHEIYDEINGHLVMSSGFFVLRVPSISTITLGFTRNYFIFVLLLTQAIMLYNSNELKKLANHYSKIPQIKSKLVELAESYKTDLGTIPALYEQFDPTQDVQPELLKFVNETLSEYKPKN